MAKFYQRIRKAFGSNDSFDSGCHDVQGGIGTFISSGTGNLISRIGTQFDENLTEVKGLTISQRDSASNSSTSGHSSDADGGDCTDGVRTKTGVKITEVNCESFAHGFGLRDGDIITSVNNKPVHSVAMVSSMILRIIKSSKNSHLRLEIHRRERGLIVLDNGGDDVYVEDDNELICIEDTTSRLKNARFRKYLMATPSKIGLSNFRTPLADKNFTMKRYAKVVGDDTERFIALKHDKTNKWIQIENGNITLQPPPNHDGLTLPVDSKYLINICPSSGAKETLRPVDETDKAIGFLKRKDAATLISPTNRKARFQIFTESS